MVRTLTSRFYFFPFPPCASVLHSLVSFFPTPHFPFSFGTPAPGMPGGPGTCCYCFLAFQSVPVQQLRS